MSKPVQVCTACQFVTLIIYGQNYSQVGNKKPVHLHPNWAEVPNSTSAQFEQKLIRTCTQVGHKSYCAKKTGKQGKVIALCSFLHFLLRLNLQNSLSGKSPGTHRHQMQLVQKVRKQLGKQGKAVPLSSFLKNRPSVIF